MVQSDPKYAPKPENPKKSNGRPRRISEAVTPGSIERPAHYGGDDDPFETIKVLKAWLSPEQYLGFLRGNAIKYESRAGKKGSESEDHRKAAQYSAWAAEQAKEMGR